MSADLFAIFGAPNRDSYREQLDDKLNVPRNGPELNPDLQPRHIVPTNGDILFDADEAEAEDDFGDFEDVEATSLQERPAMIGENTLPSAPSVPMVSEQFNLLDLGDEPAPEVEQQHRQFPSMELTNEVVTAGDADEWGDFEDFAQETQLESKPVAASSTPYVPDPTLILEHAGQPNRKDDVWDDFDDWNAEQTIAEAVGDDISTSTRPRPELPDEPRPANIPPPMILLQLLPQVFQSIQDLAKIAEDDAEIDETAASIVTVFAVSARIIAGRSLRWKRDTYLAQSTRIGPSISGARSGGMKLTAINKSEAIREEREAADICDAWSRNTHIFASIVTRSEHRRPWMNLNIKMTPRPSPGFGTLEAKEPCALCGIKRDERIAGVDFDADDVFHEYWTEHWGHTDCKVFWYTYRDMLDQR